MSMMTGTLTINAVNDTELRKVLEIKIKNEAKLTFNPAQMQLQPKTRPELEQTYNNLVLGWKDRDGLKAVKEVLTELEDKVV